MIRASAILLAGLALASCSPGQRSASADTAEAPAKVAAASDARPVEVAASASDYRVLAEIGLAVFPAPQPLPAVEFTTRSLKRATLDEYAGKYVLLNFWATWCPPCREEMPSMQRLQDTLGGADFSVFAVSVGEDPATVEAFLKKYPYTFPIFLDPKGTVSSMFVGRGIPTTYVLDREGRAVAGVVGSRPWDDEKTLAAFRALIAGK